MKSAVSAMKSTIDSNTVLWGQAIIYTMYVLAIMALVAWFAYNITRTGPSKVKPAYFYAFVAMLVTVGVSIHLITYNTIPWTKVDLNGKNTPTAQQFDIKVAKHKFQLPTEKLEVQCGKLVQFNVISEDLTYGFGLFRPDNSMVFQMQVIPSHDNIIKWIFPKNETLTIRSTEYSGPQGAQMIVKNAVNVSGCTK